MKFEANWKFKSLDSLEKVKWSNPEYDSHLVETVHQLRPVPLNKYGIEDLRIMIGQNIGLKFLIPLALEKLEKNLFAEGDFTKVICYKQPYTLTQTFGNQTLNYGPN